MLQDIKQHARLIMSDSRGASLGLKSPLPAQDEAQRLAVEEHLYTQILAAGAYSPEDSRTFAQWTAAFYATYAQRCATTARELYQRYPLKVLPSPSQASSIANGRLSSSSSSSAPASVPTLSQTAWHGSRLREIERFSTQYIGTGEGSQAYGWGLYFASKKEVAAFYRATITRSRGLMGVNGKAYGAPQADAEADASRLLILLEQDRRAFEQYLDGGQSYLGRIANDIVRGRIRAAEGKLYEVDIPEDEDLLLWDQPLVEQPERVKAGIELLFANGALDDDTKRLIHSQGARCNLSGKKLYEALTTSDNLDNDGTGRAASLALAAAGIKGIKYLDGSSRAAGQGGHNYVIFDGEDVRLQQVVLAQGAREGSHESAPQGTRGSFRPSDLSMALHAGADHSTWIHEAGHFYLEVLSDLASQPDAPREIVQDMEEVLHWMGIEGDAAQEGLGNPVAQPAPPPGSPAPSRWRSDLGLYSALAQGIEGIDIRQAAPEAWRQAIKGLLHKGAVKADEVEWSGIHDWLGLQQGKVSKEQVAQYLEQGGVRVTETVLGNGDRAEFEHLRDEQVAILEGLGYDIRWEEGRDGEALEGVTQVRSGRTFDIGDGWEDGEAEEAMDRLDEILAAWDERLWIPNDDRGLVEYQQYQLPGGTNYREVLLTLPLKAATVDTSGWTAKLKRAVSPVTRKPEYEVFNAAGGSQGTSYSETTDEAAIRNVASTLARRGTERGNYKSPHWAQPNVIAHVRMNDRTDADGQRILFVEELQSDWGQDGKKRGFKPAKSRSEQDLLKLRQARNELADRLYAKYGVTTGMDFRGVASQEDIDSVDALTNQINSEAFSGSHLPPAAPFVTKTEGWLNLALKRVMVMAAEGGYDRVAFVNGEQSAERYDLSKQFERVTAYKETGGTYRISAADINGNTLPAQRAKDAAELEGIVGKELAQKIVDQKSPIESYSGLALKVGGEGMKAFYDQILPSALKKLLPKVGGGAMGTVKIGTGKDNWAVVDATDDGEAQVLADGFTTRENALAKLEEYDGGVEVRNLKGGGVQLGFDITPAMREQVAYGLPLFGQEALYSDVGKRSTHDPGSSVLSQLALATRPDWRAALSETSAFQKWFGRSKVVDENGRPLVVYHGTNQRTDFSEFDGGDRGIWFTEDSDDAGSYALWAGEFGAPKPRVIPVYVSIKSPYAPTKAEMREWKDTTASDDGYEGVERRLVAKARRLGHDGIQFDNGYWVALEPTQIKSAIGNDGSFDRNDPGILSQGPIAAAPIAPGAIDRLTKAIRHVYRKPDLWTVLVDESSAASGPFDGGCLICARAILMAAGQGELVRITSDLNGGQTEHYGARIGEFIVDFSGTYSTPESWIASFAALENVRDRALSYAPGYDDSAQIIEDPVAAQKVGDLLRDRIMQGRPFSDNLAARPAPVEAAIDLDGLIPRGAPNATEPIGRLGREGGIRKRADREVDTPEFKKWFGVSKVVDPEGRPLEVYHGTDEQFDTFRPGEIYFAEDPTTAEDFGDRLVRAYISIKNPLAYDYAAGAPMSAEEAQAAGYDGFKVENYDTGDEVMGNEGAVWVAFHSAQIKSAIGNDGSFDRNDPNVLSQRGRFAMPDEDVAVPCVKPSGTRSALQVWQSMTLAQKRPFHERWAKAVEQYALEGRAPSLALRPIMARLASWLGAIYGAALRRLQLQPKRPAAQAEQPAASEGSSPHVAEHAVSQTVSQVVSQEALPTGLDTRLRQVLDRMLASDEELHAMQQEIAAQSTDNDDADDAVVQDEEPAPAWPRLRMA